MSYLQRTSGVPSFKEAVISFWFRVPGETMGKVKMEWDGQSDPSPLFNGIIPLLVIGKEGREDGVYDGNAKPTVWMTYDFTCDGVFMNTHAEYLGEVCNSWNDFHFIYDFHCCLTADRTTMYTATPDEEFTCHDFHDVQYKPVYSPKPHEVQPSEPTCIGVDDEGHLYVNFQTAKQPKITGDEGSEYVTSISAGSSVSTSGNQGYSEGPQVTHITYDSSILGCVGLVDTAVTEGPTVHPGVDSTGSYKQPQEKKSKFPPLPYETGKFFSGSSSTEVNWSNKIEVSPDKWHHVLVSVKLQTTKTHNEAFVSGASPQGYAGGSLLYIALDDVNYTKEDLSQMWDWGGSDGKFGPNEVFPDLAWDIATDYYRPDADPPGVQMTYELSEPEVPSGFIGIPAVSKYEDKVLRTEMAELQIWFGQSMDTGDTSNRRLFIDKDGKPVKSEVAAKELGTPHILLHGSSNWKKGIIKGKLAPPTEEGKPPKPYFRPVPAPAAIVRWKPDPSLYGPQSPNEK